MRRFIPRLILPFAALLLSAAVLAQIALAQVAPVAQVPAIPPARGILAHNGMVVAQESRAARIGIEILDRGGNAVDAAVAVGFALAVTYPRAGNIGGGGFMVIHLAKIAPWIIATMKVAIWPSTIARPRRQRRPRPCSSTPKANLTQRSRAIRRSAVGVPGTVAGLALAHREIRLRQTLARRFDRAGDHASAQWRRRG